jgi:uncharacterized membrane protein
MEAKMSHILVITFDDENQAVSVLDSLKSLEHKSLLSIKDAAVIVKDAEGKVQIKNMVESGVKWGALGGGALGLLIGGLLFPVGGVLIGAAAGALIGKTFETGVDKKFIQEVRDSLDPSSSAILFIIGSENVDALIAVLEPYNGKIYHSSFDTGAEESIERALK